MFDSELMSCDDALYVEGVGWIAQYHCWLDMLWEKGIPYFIRDVKFLELKTLQEDVRWKTAKDRKKRMARLVADVQLLNSKIRRWEQCQSKQS